jgi:hypothetical protein
MPLPNPHGALSGQIAHNSIYDTGVTPGSTGGKFIGFGEEGTSYITNRANWALSENIDYVYQIIAGDRAIPAGASFTSSGQSTYQIMDDVWVGDSGYPADEEEGRLILFAVLDDQYNELTDINGNEVRVAIVRDSTNTTNAYKNEFENNPVITFKTVDSSGADVPGGNPYTIPAAQAVRVLYGSLSNFENLPTDALVKFKLQSATEVEAGAFLQDGTKKMTGDADWNEKRLLNPLEIRGASGLDLLIRSQQHLNLNADEAIKFKDQNTPSDVFLSWGAGGTEVEGYHGSILSSLNSKSTITGALVGNRSLDKTGSITFTPGTGQVAWPTLNVTIDGERRVIAAGNIIVSNTGSTVYFLAVNNAGTVVERTTLANDDIPLTAHAWNGSTFNVSVDLRWAYSATSRSFEVTCGDGGGCDFSAIQLELAVEVACAFTRAYKAPGVVKIKGHAYLASANSVTVRQPVAIIGEGPGISVIHDNETTGDSNNFIECNSNMVRIENLTLMHSGDNQSPLCAIKNAGSYSIFRNLWFERDPGTYDVNFGYCFAWDAPASGVLIDKIFVGAEITDGFLLGTGGAYDTPYLTESRIRDVEINPGSLSPSEGIVANGSGNIIENVEIKTGLNDYGIIAGNDTLIDRCKIRMTGAAGVAPAGILYKPLSGATYHQSMIVRDSYFLRCDDGIRCEDLTGITGRAIIRGCHFVQTDRPFNFSAIGTPTTGQVLITECFTSSTNEYVAMLTGAMRYTFSDNVCVSVGGCGVAVGVAATAKILGNEIAGYGSAGAYDNAIYIGYLSGGIHIANNQIGDVGAPASSTMVELNWTATITNNHMAGSGNAGYGIRTIPSGFFGAFTSIENRIIGNTLSGFTTTGIRIAAGFNYIWNGTLIAHNRFWGFAAGKLCIEVDEAEGVVIDSNVFGGDVFLNPIIGRAIYIHESLGGAAAANCQIINNHFKAVAGASGSSGAPRVVEVNGGHGTMIAKNTFQECGAFDAAHYVVGNNAAVIYVINCPDFQISDNYIRQLRGYSSTADNNDTFYGIYTGNAGGQVHGNYISHDFGVAGYVASDMYGIFVNWSDSSVTNNHVHWYGTQPDANKSDVTVAISCNPDYCVICGNTVTGLWTVAGVTTSRAIDANGDGCAITGNGAHAGGGGFHDIWVGGSGGVVVGNAAMGAGTITWNGGTNNPDAAQYGNVNNTAVSHG